MRVLVVAMLVLAMLAVPSSAQAAEIEIGTDAVDDDTKGPAGSGGTGVDLSNVDDIQSGNIWSADDAIHFRFNQAEAPGDTTQGQYCWMPAFQVKGDETEYVGLMCESYTAGSGGGFEAGDTNRGTEVASAAAWDGSSVVVTVPYSNLGVSTGSVLEDIYFLTYGPNQGQDGLYVDDVMPDAKSDRNAPENLGCYVVGAGPDDDWSNCNGAELGGGEAPTSIVYQDFDGELLQVSVDSQEPSTMNYVYNWTAPGSTFLQFTGRVDEGSAESAFAQDGATLWSHTFTGSGDTGQETIATTAGATQLWLNLTDFVGSLNIQVFPEGYDSGSGNQTGGNQTGGSSSPGGNTAPPADDGDEGDDEDETATDDGSSDPDGEPGEDSPGVGFLAVLAMLAVAVLRRK